METQQPSQPPPMTSVPFLPQHIITSGTRKDCIRLRGLPYEASVEQILEFLGEYAKNIVLQGVHMVYNAQVRLAIRNPYIIRHYFIFRFFKLL